MPVGKGCKRAAAIKLGGAHVEQKGHETHYGPTYGVANMTRYGPPSSSGSYAY